MAINIAIRTTPLRFEVTEKAMIKLVFNDDSGFIISVIFTFVTMATKFHMLNTVVYEQKIITNVVE